MSKHFIILANGNLEDPEALRARLANWENALVVAADGGSRHAGTLGLVIHATIGDLDSLDPEDRLALSSSGTKVQAVPSAKDETDLELAALYAVAQGASHIAVVGALGGRVDMTIANLMLLTHPKLLSARIELWHGWQTAWLIRPPGDQVPGQPGDTLSLIPVGGAAEGITTQSLAYPLQEETLAFGPTRGVSNVLTDQVAHVVIKKGTLLAVHTPASA
jgi:thiamine pyrophosphokinase